MCAHKSKSDLFFLYLSRPLLWSPVKPLWADHSDFIWSHSWGVQQRWFWLMGQGIIFLHFRSVGWDCHLKGITPPQSVPSSSVFTNNCEGSQRGWTKNSLPYRHVYRHYICKHWSICIALWTYLHVMRPKIIHTYWYGYWYVYSYFEDSYGMLRNIYSYGAIIHTYSYGVASLCIKIDEHE